MSDQYFKCAKDSKCVGLKKDMKGFHECANAAKCKKPKKAKLPRRPENRKFRNLKRMLLKQHLK